MTAEKAKRVRKPRTPKNTSKNTKKRTSSPTKDLLDHSVLETTHGSVNENVSQAVHVAEVVKNKTNPKNRYAGLRNKAQPKIVEEFAIPSILPEESSSENDEEAPSEMETLVSTLETAFSAPSTAKVLMPENAFNAYRNEIPESNQGEETSDEEFVEPEPEPSDAESLSSSDSFTSYDSDGNEKNSTKKTQDIIDEIISEDPPISNLNEEEEPNDPPEEEEEHPDYFAQGKRKRNAEPEDDFIEPDVPDEPPRKKKRKHDLSVEDIMKLGALKVLSFTESTPYLKGITQKCNEDVMWNSAFEKCTKKWRKQYAEEMKPEYMLLFVTGLLTIDVIAVNKMKMDANAPSQ